MAPVPGISRAEAIRLVSEHDPTQALRIDLGTPHRCAAILYTPDTSWRIVSMVVDDEEVMRASEKAREVGYSFMPEHVVELQKPGPVEHGPFRSRLRFLLALRMMDWTRYGFG